MVLRLKMLEINNISNPRNVWFTSDSHWGHTNIIKYCNRPFENDSVMNEHLTKIWNTMVDKNDLVFHIGDVSAGLKGRQDLFGDFLSNLNGTKILIRGNHDHEKDSFYIKNGFSSVQDYMEIGDYFLCHFPLKMDVREDWIKQKERDLHEIFKKSKCTKIIHGHSHTEQYGGYRFNVGVDLHDFNLVNMNHISNHFTAIGQNNE